MYYLYHMFTPYITTMPTERFYYKLGFFLDSSNKFMVKESDGKYLRVEKMISYIESFLIKRTIVEKNYLMLHGGAIESDDKAYLLLADSCGGKSTATSFLCMNGFRYITDDRIIINTQTSKVIPFPKTIMLRTGTVDLLKNQYGIEIQSMRYKYRGLERDFFRPMNVSLGSPSIAHIYILRCSKDANIELHIEEVDRNSRVKYLLMSSHTTSNLANVRDFSRLASENMSIIHYSNLNDLKRVLQEE